MKKSNRVGSRIFIGLTFLFLYLPILLLIIFSFNAGESSAVWQGFSLKWYTALFQNRLIMNSLYAQLDQVTPELLRALIDAAAQRRQDRKSLEEKTARLVQLERENSQAAARLLAE